MINFMHAWAYRSRPHRNDIRRMDCPGARRAFWQAHSLALSMCMRRRKGCPGVRSYLGSLGELRPQSTARSDGPQIWQMDGVALRSRHIFADQLLALPVRMRKGTGSLAGKFGETAFRVVWLHDRTIRQEAPDQTRNGGNQAVHDLAHDVAAVQQSEEQTLCALRRSRHPGLRALAKLFGFLGRYGCNVSGWVKYRESKQRRTLRTWQLCLDYSIRSGKEQTSIVGVELL